MWNGVLSDVLGDQDHTHVHWDLGYMGIGMTNKR